MDQEVTKIEAELAKLIPVSLSEDFLSQLDEAMVTGAAETAQPEGDVIVATCDPELAELEEGLRALAPFGMPDDLISRLDEAMKRWHEEVPVEEKVIPMHPVSTSGSRSNGLGLRSVAAVGILGAALAFVPGNLRKDENSVASSQRIPVLTSDEVSPASFVSKDARSSLVSANDHGVVWTKSGKALRCVELEVKNSLEFVRANGDRLFIEKPKREVRFVPAKFD